MSHLTMIKLSEAVELEQSGCNVDWCKLIIIQLANKLLSPVTEIK